MEAVLDLVSAFSQTQLGWVPFGPMCPGEENTLLGAGRIEE